MNKFENVDVLAALEQIMRQNTAFYQGDFEIDKEMLRQAAASDKAEDKTLLWMSRPSGTYCFRERDVFLQESPIKAAEMTTEQNYNMIDGVLNNAPTMGELEAMVKAGEQVSLLDVAEAAKAEARKSAKTTQRQKKPSIRAQLAAVKEEQKKQPPAREKTKEKEVGGRE